MSEKKLVDYPVTRFLELLGAGTPTPGGGGVTALAGALAASLGKMVAGLTLGREKFQDAWPQVETASSILEKSGRRLLELVDLDSQAYDLVTSAFRLPKENEDQKAVRVRAVAQAFLKATEIPFETLQETHRLLEPLETVLKYGNPNGLSDAGVAILLVRAAGQGAAYNVRINLAQLSDPAQVREFANRTAELLSEIQDKTGRMERIVEAGL